MLIYSDTIIFIMEILGTIAFASSGAMLAIRKQMDILGVNVLGLTVAVGGGVIRDLTLGITPPMTFRNPVYACIAFVTSTGLFVLMYQRRQLYSGAFQIWYDRIMMLCDTIGLGIFTMNGAHYASWMGYGDNMFLVVFVAVVTGVGGGIVRDVMAGEMPYILKKHVYALPAILGAVLYVLLHHFIADVTNMFVGTGVIVILRLLAAKYRWNLPRISKER